MRFDLHIHSCLSPCASLDMAPSAIAQRAVDMGLDAVAVTDHNSAKNAPAFNECCGRLGLKVLFGMEICTSEEFHVLSLFDTVEQALNMTDWVYDALIKRVNQPEVFGDQPVVNADDEIEELEWRMLGTPTKRDVYQVGRRVKELDGLFIACHVDRSTSSIFSQLGAPAGDEGFDAMELSRTADETVWRGKLSGAACVRSSDAHNIEDLGVVWTETDSEDFSVEGLRKIFRTGNLRLSPPLRFF